MGQKFSEYVCAGDTVEREIEGFIVTAQIVHDESHHIDDDDVHSIDPKITGCTEEQHDKLMLARDAWRRDEWFYCGVVLSIARAGIELDDQAASLWGIEANYPDGDNAYLTAVIDEMMDEALTAGKAKVAALVDSVPTVETIEIVERPEGKPTY